MPCIAVESKFWDLVVPMNTLTGSNQGAALSFYTALPTEQLNYEEFKEYAQARLKLLRRVENNIKDTHTIRTMEEDLVGHACLKLICCQSRWAAIWFVNMETQLFRLRLDKNAAEMKRFFAEKFWPHVRADEGRPGVVDGGAAYDPAYLHSARFIHDTRVHFSQCSDLLPRRIYALERGFFEFNDDVMRSWLICEFRRYTSARVNALYEQLVLVPDDRLERLAGDFFSRGTAEGATDKEVLAKDKHFPLCMQGLLEKLRAQKRLKYNDRQALCLFLKDIGLPLDSTIHFFRTHFNVPLEQFNKEYLYSIRHNYGLEGKRANYSSFSCAKLMGLASDPSSFGCPFVKNAEYVRSHTDIEDLGGDAHACCSKTGAKSAGHDLDGPFATPAEYFRLCEKAADGSAAAQ
ncbi:DNA primase large subunit [Pancytospora philotis]|nr:DNA primase large subunit [Pancytospora philotis]